MATSYPGGLDSFTNPTASDPLNSATVPHATQHADANDAIEAIQAELGTDPAGASATVAARLTTIEGDITTIEGDARWTDARTPTAHAASHASAGSDPITIAQSQVTDLTTDLAGKAARLGLYLPGASGNYVSAPDSAAVSITGDLDAAWKVALADWTTGDVAFGGKYATAPNMSWRLLIRSTGVLRFQWSADGTNLITQTGATAVPFADGATGWIRVTLDVDNGASGYDVKFYTSTDGTSWTQLGTTLTGAGVTSIADTTAVVEIGSTVGGTNTLSTGVFYEHWIKSGIGGTTVAHWKSDWPAARLRDAYGVLWTVNGTANGWVA